MNVLILTPDAVGSTLLQRLLTIYMQFHDFDRPVINLHELTNGLEKYYSPEFNREIVSKSRVKSWGYYQSLQDVVEILDSVDHYKTSRLAQYHIKGRNDPIDQQVPFYRYLDDNFFIIACRRHNLFEHGLSMAINKITKKLNVYDHGEKINTFYKIYQDQIDLDQGAFTYALDAYRDYIDWSARYFNVGSYFYYDHHLDHIERYILNLPVFHGQQRRVTWQEKFDIDLNDWNRCHHMPSDLAVLAMDPSVQRPTRQINDDSADIIADYQRNAPAEWPAVNTASDFGNLPAEVRVSFQIKHQIRKDLQSQRFLRQNQMAYDNAQDTIKRMQQLDIIVSPPPIKKQTLLEKSIIIKNFDQCMDTYNSWVMANPDIATEITRDQVDQQIAKEQDFWNQRHINQDTSTTSGLIGSSPSD